MKNTKESGFTLIEMLIVLMIISVLIILIVPNVTKSTEDIYDKGCIALTSVVQAQVNLYYMDKGKYPESLEELAELGYIADDQKKCSNNIPLKYKDGLVSQ